MGFFTSGFFWFAEGVLFTIALLAFRAWAQDRAIPMPYWKWIALGIWTLLAGFTLAFVGTSIGEGEPTAAMRGGILFGVIVVISGAGLWRLLMIGAGTGERVSEAGP